MKLSALKALTASALLFVVTTSAALSQQTFIEGYQEVYDRFYYDNYTSEDRLDAIQDVMLRAVENASLEKEVGNPVAYLVTAERNARIDRHRTQNRRHEIFRNNVFQITERFYGGSNETNTLTEEYLDEMLEALDEEAGEILVMLLQGSNKSQIARELGKPRARVDRVINKNIMPVATTLAENW